MELRYSALYSQSDRRLAVEGPVLRHYAPVYREWSTVIGTVKFRGKELPMIEQFDHGAWASFIASGEDCIACFDHDEAKLLGRRNNATLTLAEDQVGHQYAVTVDERVSWVKDLLLQVERGDLTGSSFAFVAAPLAEGGQKFEVVEGQLLRTVLKVQRGYHVGPVPRPAYESSRVVSVDQRSSSDLKTAISDWEASEAPVLVDPDQHRRWLVARARSALAG